MTSKQTSLYWRLWQKACKANAWREQKGYLDCPPPKSDPAQFVITAATALADQNHRAMTLNDLRHGAHVVAARRDCGHDNLSQKEISRVFTLFKLLIDHEDLEALNAWTNPELEAEERERAFIRNVPEAYVQGCVERMTAGQTRDWQSLSDHDRRALVIILSNARDRWQKPLASSPSAPSASLREKKA